jgi:hypothetical protein
LLARLHWIWIKLEHAGAIGRTQVQLHEGSDFEIAGAGGLKIFRRLGLGIGAINFDLHGHRLAQGHGRRDVVLNGAIARSLDDLVELLVDL